MSLFDFNKDDKTSLSEGMFGIGIVLGLLDMDAENDEALRKDRPDRRPKKSPTTSAASRKRPLSQPAKAHIQLDSQNEAQKLNAELAEKEKIEQSTAEKEEAQQVREHFEALVKQQRKQVKPEFKKMIFPIVGGLFLVGACLFGLGSSLIENNPYDSYGSPTSLEEYYSAQATLEELEGKLPYIGLNEELIDHSWLGKHDEYAEVISGGNHGNATAVYIWKSKNGLNDDVFSAYVKDGEVVSTVRHQPESGYWPDNGTYMPDRHFIASSENVPEVPDEKTAANNTSSSKETTSSSKTTSSQTPSVTLKPNYYDPMDYDSPEEYADDAEEWFKSEGYKDPWIAAYEHWEGNH